MFDQTQNRTTLITLLVLVFVIAVVVFIFVRWQNSKSVSLPTESAGTDAFESDKGNVFTTMNGQKQADLSVFEGHVRVVYFWASWSPYAVTDLPVLDSMASQSGNEEVVFMAVNRNENPDIADKFLSHLTKMPHLIFAINKDDSLFKQVSGNTMPETLVYDANGNIIWHKQSVFKEADLQGAIETAKLNKN